MPSFEEALARMKDLYTYGKEVNESNNLKTHTLEHRAVAADGVTYGIIRENTKYYIKSAPKGKETIAEAYNYLGGFCNKGNYEYNSYAKALKQFELKLASINEAHDQKVNIESLDPFRANKVLNEATESMRNEIARQRQIMYNAAMLMNESTEIGADRKNDVVKYDGKNPEAETGKKGDEGGKKATAQPEYKGSKTNGVNKKVGPFNQNASASKEQLKEDAGDIGDAPLHSNTENWGTEGIGKGRDPKQVGWEMDGQKTVNEEENDWASEGLPSTPGVGEADTDHNNGPFNKGLNEEDFDDEFNDVEDDEFEDGEDLSTDTDFDDGVEDVDDVDGDGESYDIEVGADDEDLDGEDFDDDSEELGDEDFDDEEELGGEEDIEGDDDLDGGEDLEDDDIESDEFEDGEDIPGEEPEFDGDAESFIDDGEDDLGDEDELGGDEFDDEEGISDDLDGEVEDDEDVLGDDDDLDECGGGAAPGNGQAATIPTVNEAKRKIMNKIVESVTKKILSEDELHVFGKHPGYRKKPMELPTTGEDKNQWGEDWNDESVYSEEPFGSKIGDGDPFNNLVDAVTKDVMYQLKAGIPIEGSNKKKE